VIPPGQWGVWKKEIRRFQSCQKGGGFRSRLLGTLKTLTIGEGRVGEACEGGGVSIRTKGKEAKDWALTGNEGEINRPKGEKARREVDSKPFSRK